MKDNVTYNHADNKVMVRTDGDLIYVICNKENQQKKSYTISLMLVEAWGKQIH